MFPNNLNGQFGQFQNREDVKYVNGMESARQYQMQPGSSAILMDANSDVFYYKTTDASGMATIKTYEFKEVDTDGCSYVTKNELRRILDEFIAGIDTGHDEGKRRDNREKPSRKRSDEPGTVRGPEE